MESTFKSTGLRELDLDQDPQTAQKNKMGTFDEAYIQKAYARAQVKDDKTVTIAIRSHHIIRKVQALVKTVSPSVLDIAPSDDPSITSCLNSTEYYDASLLGVSLLALYPAGNDVSFLCENDSLTGNDVYPLGGESLVGSTTTGHTIASKLKHST